MNIENQNQEEEMAGTGKERTQVVLQPRDKEALAMIYEQQFLTFDQYKNSFFKDAWPQQARARLLKLQRAGFVRKALSPAIGQAQVIKLTPIGAQMMNGLHWCHVPYNQRIEHGTAEHDKTVTDIRIRLKGWAPNPMWLAERYLKAQKWGNHVPDGALSYQVGDDRASVAIEYERFAKAQDSYRSILSFYEKKEHYTWALYVVPYQSLYNILQKIFFERLSFMASRIALVHLRDLMNGYPPFQFKDEARQIFLPPKEKVTL